MQALVKFPLLFVLLVASAASAWSADGRILSFTGDVRINGEPVTTDTLLKTSDTVVTAAGASVKIVLSDNSVIDLDSDSEIQLSDYSYHPAKPDENKARVSIFEGTLRYVSGLIAKENPDDIGFTAGNSTIGVRGSFTAIAVDGIAVNVEAMIGEATLAEETADGEKVLVVVPTGKATRKDSATGQILVTPATVPNAVNEVVRAMAGSAPDANSGLPTDKGCSAGQNPLRAVARPGHDEAIAAAIAAQLADLSPGELMMVVAVMINNAKHLCIDPAAVSGTVALIATVRPDEAGNIVFVATLLDPANAKLHTDAALQAAPDQVREIEQARSDAEILAKDFDAVIPPRPVGGQPADPPPARPDPPVVPERDVPPGGSVGAPPSPE